MAVRNMGPRFSRKYNTQALAEKVMQPKNDRIVFSEWEDPPAGEGPQARWAGAGRSGSALTPFRK